MQRTTALAAVTLLIPLVTATPPSPDYAVLDGGAEPFRSAFNADVGKVRLVMYVAPTCGGCLRGADRTQKDVLVEIEDENLTAYVVWVKKNGARERHVDRVLRLVTDDRATHYWDEGNVMLRAYDELLDIGGSPCAGAFLLYGPDARWEGELPPAPEYWQDAHPELHRSDADVFDGEGLAQETRALLNGR